MFYRPMYCKISALVIGSLKATYLHAFITELGWVVMSLLCDVLCLPYSCSNGLDILPRRIAEAAV